MNFRTFTLLFTLICTLALNSIQTTTARNDENRFNLLFRTGSFPVAENIDQFVNDFQSVVLHDEVIFRIIQFHHIPDQYKRLSLANGGIELLDFIPGMSYYAAISPDAHIALLREMNARAVIGIQPEYKLDFDLFAEDYPEHALRPEERIELFIHHFTSVAKAEVMSKLTEKSIYHIEDGIVPGYFLVSAPIQEIQWIASLPFVQFIEPVHPPSEPENDTGTTLHRSSAINSPHPLGRKYDGAGVNVMLQDDGIIGPHIDYHGRIAAQYISFNSGNHGDHVAGTIMGAGNIDPRATGMAPGSTLYMYGVNVSGYQGFNLISSHYFNPGIRITSTSYSNGCNAGYNSLARTMDIQSRLYPSLIHVFSAGNSGGENCGYGAGAGWGNITGGHKAAKNVIAVGNVSLIDDLSGSSSRGPAFDGRIKPEVVAKGSSVYSTTDPHQYAVMSGTSMACPGVSGTLAQLYQAYHLNHEGEDPEGGLMKAILMNTADDLGNAGPDFRFGFGRINALRAAQTIESHRFDSAYIEQDEQIIHYLEVPEHLHEIRIMIYWTDYESSVATTKALVNDVDLEVATTDGEVFQPWVLNLFPHPDSLNKPAFRGIDNINNVEQVTIRDPQPGVYEIVVTGFEIPLGPQKYFVSWEFITKDFYLTYPAGGESFVPGRKELIRWDSPDYDSLFILEFSIDNGNTWNLINANVPANRRYFEWTPPGVATAQALIRLTQGGESVTAEFPFNIIGVPQNLQIDWVCDSSFRISWDVVYGATAYQVLKLGEKYMEPVGISNSTSLIVEDLAEVESWVTVQALGDVGATGERAYAIRKQPGLNNCGEVDLELDDIVSTSWMLYNIACCQPEDFPVEIRVKNRGSQPAEGFHAGYSINDSILVIEELNVILMPDSVLMHVFEEAFTMMEPGNYVVKAWISHEEDINPVNDTIRRVITLIDEELINPYPYYQQNFDDFSRCVTWPICEMVVCNLSEGWHNLINNSQDEIDWRAWGGNTPTNLTGPSSDHTTGTNAGNYLYLRASVLCFDKEAILVSPYFDLTQAGSGMLSFWYHMYGIHSGRIHVDAFMNNTIYHDIMPPLIGEQGNEWKPATIPLDDFIGSIVSFRIRGVTGPGQLSDIAIDDVEISSTVGTRQAPINSMNLEVFPNPADGIFNLRMGSHKAGKIRILVTDMPGKTVFSTEQTTTGAAFTHQLDLRRLPSGVYFLVVSNDSGLTQRKLIKK